MQRHSGSFISLDGAFGEIMLKGRSSVNEPGGTLKKLGQQTQLTLGYDTDTVYSVTPGGIGYGTSHPPPRPYGNADLAAARGEAARGD